MGLLIILIIACLLSILPLGFCAEYKENDPGIWVIVGPVRFRVFSSKIKQNRHISKSKKKPSNRSENSTNKQSKSTTRGGSYKDFIPVIKTIYDFLGHFRRKIRINRLELKITLVGDDPSDLAVNYGKAWAALGNVMPQLERVFVIKQRDLEVACDFLGNKTMIYARVDATITLGRVLHLLSRHGIKILRQLLQLKKLQKGGANL